MEDNQFGPFESIVQAPLQGIWSVTEDSQGNLYTVCQTGFVYTIIDRQCQQLYNTGGQPTSLIYDQSNTGYICDMAHQRILCQSQTQNGRLQVTQIVKDYQGKPLLGPNGLAYNQHNNYIYFTDSGPLGESSLASPKGSIFAADLELLVLKPIALNCLAHPCGIAVSADGRILYVAETLNNRVLRISQHPSGVHHLSVFYEFAGRLGPTALAVSENGLIFVARFDFAEFTGNGMVSVLDGEGNLVTSFGVPGAPEITGLYFSKIRPNVLYITESSSSMAYRLVIPSDQFQFK